MNDRLPEGAYGHAAVTELLWRHQLPLREYVSGPLARVACYERGNGRCPGCEFLDEIEQNMQRKFAGQFDALTKQGPTYCNWQRFRPLTGLGKPLWEFKEFDHRLYCHRQVVKDRIVVVVFNGWAKDKSGRTAREDREIQRAQALYAEFLDELSKGECKL